MDQFDEEPDEAHNAEADGRSDCDFLELLSVGLRAALDQTQRVLGEHASGVAELDDLVHFGGLEEGRNRIPIRFSGRGDILEANSFYEIPITALDGGSIEEQYWCV